MQVNTLRFRAILGWLGMALPIIVAILALVFNCLNGRLVPDSISATYYLDPCITPFMIILGASGIFLICYNGYDKQDDIICTLAGIFGLFICIFPCSATALANVGMFQLPRDISGLIHNLSAVIFFLLLAYNSYFLFTKGGDNPTPKKLKRNLIYRICGIGMVASFLLLIPGNIFHIYGMTWFVETIALAFFGISWLTKADIYLWLFCDTPYKD